MNYLTAYHTDIGTVKTSNQDSLAIKSARYRDRRVLMALICDGMGGLSKGELASKEVVEAFCQWFDLRIGELLKSKIDLQILKNEWNRLIILQNNRLVEYGKENGIELGTTLTLMLTIDEYIYIAHVGDTRLYEIGREVRQLTNDQTVVEALVKQKKMTRDEAKKDRRRNILLQCIGVNSRIEPEYAQYRLKKDSNYLICSDGFRHEITIGEIGNGLCKDNCTSEEIMRDNLMYLTETVKLRNEKDNISTILISPVWED